MPPHQDQPLQQPQLRSISPQNSASPLLPGGQKGATASHDTSESYLESGKRLIGLGKKKPQQDLPADLSTTTPSDMASGTAGPLMPQTQAAIENMRPTPPHISPLAELKPASAQSIPSSPSRHPYPGSLAAAASTSRLRSSSPRLLSPASSEIFERNVQEPVPISTLENELSPSGVPGTSAHIPTHVMTEDHIPPALEASVEAITSRSLNPDDVEIVTSTAHLPAGAPVLEHSASHADLSSLNWPVFPSINSEGSEPASLTQTSGFLQHVTEEDTTSNYGTLDPNDVRRLSFISFADVVQSEHNHPTTAGASQLGENASRDNLHIASSRGGLGSNPDRAASPFRSPRSPRSPGSPDARSLSTGLTTPPPGVSSSFRSEQSPMRYSGITSGTQHGELNIETLRQAVRHTASGDLSGVRSAGMSPVAGAGEGLGEGRSRAGS